MIGSDIAKAALTGFSMQQKLIGLAVSILIWLAPAGITWLYMRGQMHAQYKLGEAACEKADAQAQANALEAFHVEQVKVSDQAKADAETIAKLLATARIRAATISRELAAYAQANPLPSGCSADDQRVRLYNEARRPPAD
jgi:hypothetical protein